MNISEARSKMNQLGQAALPFLFIIDFEMEHPMIYEMKNLPPGLLFKFGTFRNYKSSDVSHHEIELSPRPVSLQEYLPAFNYVMEEINYGNSFLTNLTFQTEIFPSAGMKEIFYQSYARYKLLVPGNFVVFSPECFVRIKEGVISSFPMKGTIDASLPYAEKRILDDIKEMAEHNTIVDLIRNDLNRVAKKVRLERFRYIEKIRSTDSQILQVSSEISGRLPSDYSTRIGDIITTLLPAGSVSGAPKKKTLEIIRKAEGEKRKYYTGVAGFFDGRNLDSFVMIRFIEKRENKFFYRSGGGITFMSEAENEYRELIQKIYVPTA